MYLTEAELTGVYYKAAAAMTSDQRAEFLAKANGYVFGIIGGIPPAIPGDENKYGLKSAVGLAFELFAKAETSQVNVVTGDITEAAPAGAFVRNKERDPWAIIDSMLKPYAEAYKAANITKSNRGVSFL